MSSRSRMSAIKVKVGFAKQDTRLGNKSVTVHLAVTSQTIKKLQYSNKICFINTYNFLYEFKQKEFEDVF